MRGRFEIDLRVHYVITDRINSTIGFVFRNRSLDALNLLHTSLKGISVNVRYQFNDRFQLMPYVVVSPGSSYTVTLEGRDTETTGNPWL